MLTYEFNIVLRSLQEQIDLFRSCGASDPNRQVELGISELSSATCMVPMSRQQLINFWSDSDQWVKRLMFTQTVLDRYNITVVGHGGLNDEVMLSHELGHVLEGHLCDRAQSENLLLCELEADRHSAYTWGIDNTVDAIYDCMCTTIVSLINLQMVEEAKGVIKDHWPRFQHLGQTIDQYRERLKEKLS